MALYKNKLLLLVLLWVLLL